MFFKKHIQWFKLFETAEEIERNLPLNKPVTVEANNLLLCVVRTPETIFAMDDKCPHQGASLSKGSCNVQNGTVVCPWHKYQFSLTNGRDISGKGDAVKTYPIEKNENGLSIGIETVKFALW